MTWECSSRHMGTWLLKNTYKQGGTNLSYWRVHNCTCWQIIAMKNQLHYQHDERGHLDRMVQNYEYILVLVDIVCWLGMALLPA
jgi:hypothetical protein